jgi:hypothetical protein
MDVVYIPAIAAFSGSASGAISTAFTNWFNQRRRERLRRSSRAIAQREDLYKDFIEETSRLYADALANDAAEFSTLVDMYALIGRMKVLSSDAVVQAAEKVSRLIIDAYLAPNRTLGDLPGLIADLDPLREFSEACRRELGTDRR